MVRRRMRGWLGSAAVGLAAVMIVACAQTDPGITTAVKTKLAADDTVKAYKIDVDTKEGVVTLAGTVDSPAAKSRAVELANTTKGVKSVVDELRLAEPAAATSGVEIVDVATDGGVTTAVKAKFLADPSIAGLKIDVDTKNHVVTLTGVVPTAADKTYAVEVARKTSGVDSVVDNLTVEKK
jgi:hyperosmotically inducible periplasmic protein